MPQTRHGAEQAKDELNGAILHDLDLKIGWGKAIVLPPIPMYTSSGTGGLAPMMAAARAIAQAPPPGQAAIAPWSSGQEKEPEDPHKGNGVLSHGISQIEVPSADFQIRLDRTWQSNPKT